MNVGGYTNGKRGKFQGYSHDLNVGNIKFIYSLQFHNVK